MSFFIKNKYKKPGDKKEQKKLKRGGKAQPPLKDVQPTETNKRKSRLEDDVSSDSEDELEAKRRKDVSEELEFEEETPQERKLRLAKQYLGEIEKQEREKHDDEQFDKSLISNRLRDDVLEQAGRLVRKVAEKFERVDTEAIRFLRNGHKLSITCLVVSVDGKSVFTGSKDANLIKWDVESGKRIKTISGGRKGTEETHLGHTSHILAMSISTDGRFLASGDESKLIRIWNPENLDFIHTFKGHRGTITGLAFRRSSHILYSCSNDRSIKVWDLDEKCYIETLFGHQEVITSIDALMRERCITAGGRDATVRIWKIVEESQLVFQGAGYSIDCVKFLDEQHFISGTDDGSISLWGLQKKKPLFTVRKAHGHGVADPNWITSLATLVNTDIFASGSQDGQIRLWQVADNYRKIVPLGAIPVDGFVNSLDFTSTGDKLIAGIGQEHRLGRWWRRKEGKNQILIVPLVFKS